MLAFISMPGGTEWLIILVIGLLLFGKRLPEIARSLGKGVVEFKKGLKEVEDEVNREPPTSYSSPSYSSSDSSSSHSRDTGQQNYGELYGQTGEQGSASVSSEPAPAPSESATQVPTDAGRD